ncbi:TonB-dependent receptor [Pseudomaricurvus alcaniphilus]|uniref:TonB-dependent receptor n=1 Tax=Pseudomaricurvus alcaniphilus TaxID=1166482 RepID=UPI00140CAB9A|nr:TonB-dependent receptor [Pseudomaricurvus alcaniphilus]NHN35899.1 TonB-dependent receptor [Pseudomaricurvus alcaniphilus]
MKTQPNVKRNALASAVRQAVVAASLVAAATPLYTQAQQLEEVVVTGIRGSLTRAMDIKREASTLVDSISAEDVGKFPDLNVAESLQRVTGVSIDRSGGEGQAVTVRGLGPQFNTVLVNGRQLATDSGGREFNFDVLAADLINGADVYKSTNATMQDGGIGATIDISTRRPLDQPGLQLLGSVKGMYETLSEETSPSYTGMVSQTFMDDKFGVLFAYSHQERKLQNNIFRTATWRPGLTLFNTGGVVASDATIPRNFAQIVDNAERTRDNGSLVFQFAPSEDVSITLDGFVSKFEVDSVVTDLSAWFEPGRVGTATIDPATRTALFFDQRIGIAQEGGDPHIDFVVDTGGSRDVSNEGYGLNVAWQINDKLRSNWDISRSTAENDMAGKAQFNVIGIKDNFSLDSNGAIPLTRFDSLVGGNNLSAADARAHFNDFRGATDKDEISEFRADFVYESDSEVFRQFSFGAYHQERDKEFFEKTNSALCDVYCGYNVPVPAELMQSFSVDNFFGGFPKDYFTYDGNAYVDWMVSDAGMAAADQALGNPAGTARSVLYDANGNLTATTPMLRNNRYQIAEEIDSFYINFDFETALGDMPVFFNIGARYSTTKVDVTAVQSFLNDIVLTADPTFFATRVTPPTEFSDGGEYSNLLPSFNIKMDIEEDMVLRFAMYDSITRPTMSQLSPATNIPNTVRTQDLTASGGNPALRPFKSENWDVSYEWYYADASSFSVAYFNKDIEDFIIRLSGPETFSLNDRLSTPGNICGNCDGSETAEELVGSTEVFTVTRPQNGETANVTGFEVALTHTFDSGFGIIANATVVDSNASLGSDTSVSFALEGLGDSQNLVLFYEADNWQVRAAYNNREGFLRNLDNGNGEPINGENFGQLDLSASYDIDDNFTIFFEGINVTEEELYQTGRFPNQLYSVEDNGSRYAIGIRGKF